MDIFLQETARRIEDDDVLAKVDGLLDWLAFTAILKRGLKRSGLGPQGYDPLVLFKCLLVAQWRGLSDPKLERALKVRLDFMLFCGLDLHGAVPNDPDLHYSADPDARWVKKGRKSTLGYKGFARTNEEGFIDKVHVTPANAGESPEFGTMIEGAKAQRVLADKAYASKANRAALKGRHRDGILRKAARNRPLRASEKRFNKLISKCRFRVEQCFGTMKRLFGLHRARYFGLAKVYAQMVMAAISQNLLKAANKITRNPETAAIA